MHPDPLPCTRRALAARRHYILQEAIHGTRKRHSKAAIREAQVVDVFFLNGLHLAVLIDDYRQGNTIPNSFTTEIGQLYIYI